MVCRSTKGWGRSAAVRGRWTFHIPFRLAVGGPAGNEKAGPLPPQKGSAFGWLLEVAPF